MVHVPPDAAMARGRGQTARVSLLRGHPGDGDLDRVRAGLGDRRSRADRLEESIRQFRS